MGVAKEVVSSNDLDISSESITIISTGTSTSSRIDSVSIPAILKIYSLTNCILLTFCRGSFNLAGVFFVGAAVESARGGDRFGS